MKLTVLNVDRIVPDDPRKPVSWRVKYAVERGRGETFFESNIPHDVVIHEFPEERLEAIIAEYNLDPTDMNTIMDMVLAEPFLRPDDPEPTLYSGEQEVVVQEGHRARCARAKLAVRLSTRGIQNPVEMIRHARIDPRRVTAIAAEVKRTMSVVRKGRDRGRHVY